MAISIVVHGGAGDIEEREHDTRRQAVREAVEAALPGLRMGGTALDAVELAVRTMEANPLLNAGYGGALNRNGVVELDAMIMDGRGQQVGAVAAVQRVFHPISLARLVMERTEHHLLVGQGAEAFAAEQQFPLVEPESLIAPRRRKPESTSDTVGAIALDSAGNIAVAVSTGGLDGKIPGRVGDSPLPGAGAYADNLLGAACATGVGEGIIRAMLTFRAVETLSDASAQEAAVKALDIFTHRFHGSGGLILMDRHGNIGIAHNTAVMPVAYTQGDQIVARVGGQGT